MMLSHRFQKLCQDCSGHSGAEYGLLAAFMGAGLLTALLAYLQASSLLT